MNWFNVDKKGLSDIVARRGKTFVIFELLQNALDCDGTTKVTVELEPIAGRPLARLRVTDDDPDGFKDLSHAYTLFAASMKKGNAEKRGRFNLGEKLVLALCDKAKIVSTTGGVIFDEDGRHSIRERRPAGSEFVATIRMTRAEVNTVLNDVLMLLPPPDVEVTVNGLRVASRDPLIKFSELLLTEVAGGDGVIEPEILRRTMRRTDVRVYDTGNDNPEEGSGWLFEMGIPVCETGDRWHVDVSQKIPLNMERDGVPAAYLKTIRTFVINRMHKELRPEDVRKPWVQAALEDRRIDTTAVVAIMEKQHGTQRVAYDPSDVEGTFIAQSRGMTVVAGGTYSALAWDNIRRAEALPPAGQVTPSRSSSFAEAELIDEADLTPSMKRWKVVVDILLRGALDAMTQQFDIVFLKAPDASTIADWLTTQYGARIRFNISNLGEKWFEGPIRWEHIDLVVHELAHTGGHHLSSGYHELMSKAAGKLVLLALHRPGYFDLSVRP